jgi:hypothetical protein
LSRAILWWSMAGQRPSELRRGGYENVYSCGNRSAKSALLAQIFAAMRKTN